MDGWDQSLVRVDLETAATAKEMLRRRRRRLDARALMGGIGIPIELDDTSLEQLEASLAFFDALLRTEEGSDLRVEVLAHRREIVARIGQLSRQAEIIEIRDAVEAKVADPRVREELAELMSEIAKRQAGLDERLMARESADANEIRKLELQERRWDMRKKLLDREPAAVLIGGLLLLVIGAALLIAMFTHTAIPELVSSAFLLILGFFFGQTASGKGDSGR